MQRYTRYRHMARSLAIVAIPLILAAPALGVRAAAPRTRTHATVQVAIQNFAFSPQTVTVAPGTTVVWTQKDTAPHTVTSDTGAWAASPDLSAGQTFSHTFTTAGTYTYHCAVHPYMTGKVIVSGSASGSGSSGGSNGAGNAANAGPGMMDLGPVSSASLVAWTGYYDDKQALYIITDTSNKAEARREHINYAPSLAKSLAETVPMYLVMNGKYAGRGPVFGSWPGEDDYTPLWQEVNVSWKNPSQAVALGRDDQITALAKAGKLTLKMTGTVLNAPIIKEMGHGS